MAKFKTPAGATVTTEDASTAADYRQRSGWSEVKPRAKPRPKAKPKPKPKPKPESKK